MTFGRFDSLLELCEKHLDDTGTRGSEIESHFVQYLLVRICAEYEIRINLMVERRCSRSRDQHLRRFANHGAKQACKHFTISDIKGNILGRFGEDYKDTFNNLAMNTTAHTAWNNIYYNRQAVAHKAGAVMSFSDIKANYKESMAVLDALAQSLGLRPKETKDFK